MCSPFTFWETSPQSSYWDEKTNIKCGSGQARASPFLAGWKEGQGVGVWRGLRTSKWGCCQAEQRAASAHHSSLAGWGPEAGWSVMRPVAPFPQSAVGADIPGHHVLWGQGMQAYCVPLIIWCRAHAHFGHGKRPDPVTDYCRKLPKTHPLVPHTLCFESHSIPCWNPGPGHCVSFWDGEPKTCSKCPASNHTEDGILRQLFLGKHYVSCISSQDQSALYVSKCLGLCDVMLGLWMLWVWVQPSHVGPESSWTWPLILLGFLLP